MTKLQVLEDLKAFLEKDRHIYDWTKPHRCNMGLLYGAANQFNLFQAEAKLTTLRKEFNLAGYWGEILPAVCSISGKSTEETIQKLFDIGFTLPELIGFEYLKGFWPYLKQTLTPDEFQKFKEKCSLDTDREWVTKKEYKTKYFNYKIFETKSFWFGLVKKMKIVKTVNYSQTNKLVVIEYLKYWIEAVKKEEKKEFHYMDTSQVAQFSNLTCN